MPQALAVTDVVTTINQAETRFNLRRTTDPQFFVEWFEALPELTQHEKETCDRTIGDEVEYPNNDLNATQLPNGDWMMTHKDGCPY